MNTKPKEQSSRVTMLCEFVGYQKEGHTKSLKRKLQGQHRKAVAAEIASKGIASSAWRVQTANELMDEDDVEPALLPTGGVLRKAKSDYNKSDQLHPDPLICLTAEKHVPPLQGVLRDIGSDRFFAFYWSSLQLQVFQECFKKENLKLCIDATGGVVRKLQRVSGKKSGHIFLYEGVIHPSDSHQQFSVVQMLSEIHDTNFIHYWLASWVRDGAPNPKEVVCDFSLALLGGCVRAFTDFPHLSSYTDHCFKILATTEVSIPPACFIRIDVAHLMKRVSCWPSLRSAKNKRVREFDLRCFGQLIKSQTIDQAKSLIIALYVVSNAETTGKSDSTEEPVPAIQFKDFLQDKISVNISESFSQDCEQVEDQNEDEILEDGPSDLGAEWLKQLTAECCAALTVDDGDSLNGLHLPDFASDLQRYCRHLPLWSAVMQPVFGYGATVASSAIVESDFNDIKNRVFRKADLPTRIDNFLQKHVESINGRIKMAVAENNLENEKELAMAQENTSNFQRAEDGREGSPLFGDSSDRPDDFESETILISTPTVASKRCPVCANGHQPTGAHMCILCKRPVHALPECSLPYEDSEEGYGQTRICCGCVEISNSKNKRQIENSAHENWRGQATPSVSKRHRRSYLESDPNFNLFDSEQMNNKVSLGLLRNANVLKPIQLHGSKYLLQNTCAFDAIMQGLLAAYCDSSTYRAYIDSRKDEISLFALVTEIAKLGVRNPVYKARAELLQQLFEHREIPGNITVVLCECTVSNLAKQLFMAIPSVKKCQECTNDHCPQHKSETMIPVLKTNYEIIKKSGMRELRSAIIGAQVPEAVDTPCLRIVRNTANIPSQAWSIRPELSENPLCTGRRNHTFGSWDDQIFVEILDLDTSNQQVSNYDSGSPMSLEQFPSAIYLGGKQYFLRSVISFVAPASGRGMGHFKCFIRRADNVFELYDDLMSKHVHVKKSEKIVPHLLMFSV